MNTRIIKILSLLSLMSFMTFAQEIAEETSIETSTETTTETSIEDADEPAPYVPYGFDVVQEQVVQEEQPQPQPAELTIDDVVDDTYYAEPVEPTETAETVEEILDEIVEEIAEEIAEEIVEEVLEEIAEEIEEIVEEIAVEVAEEIIEVEEIIEELIEENLLVAVDGRQMRIGVMPLTSSTGHDRIALEATGVLMRWLNDTGIYEVYDPETVDRTLRDSRSRIPSGCNTERCAHDIGRALKFERMILGSVDENETKIGVRLQLMNVETGRPVQTISVEGAAGVGADVVIVAALNRLHGAAAEIELAQYRGPAQNNLREFLYTTAAVQGAGLLYTAINYFAGESNSNGELPQFAPDGPYTGGGTLSGIPGSSNHIPIFARPAALGNAYTAVSDDAYGVLYNPAGMAWLSRRDAVIAYQYRFGMDIFALSYANVVNKNFGFGQAIQLITDRDGAMTEMFFVTAMGYRLPSDVLFGPMSLGASVKTAGTSVRALSPDSPKGQSYGIGLDLGMIWELSDNIRYGIMLRDFPTVNNWANRTTDVEYAEFQPTTLHMGGSYRASYSTFLTADGQIPLYADQPWVMAGGIEYEFFRMLALRVGLQREILNEDANWWKITCGAGLKIDTRSQWGQNMQLDFAYEYNTLRLFPVLNLSVRVGF